MASIPPPHGLAETDYEAIEAAVTETVRGRWFLAEYARRNRLAETRQLLDAMARIETAVLAGQTALPSADPSIRLLIQRIKEISGQLDGVAGELRAAGIDERLVEAVGMQARAVAGMMRNGAPAPRSEPARLDPPPRRPPAEASKPPAGPTPAMPRMPRAEPLATPSRHASAPNPTGLAAGAAEEDPRLAALAELDGLTLAKKLALFT